MWGRVRHVLAWIITTTLVAASCTGSSDSDVPAITTTRPPAATTTPPVPSSTSPRDVGAMPPPPQISLEVRRLGGIGDIPTGSPVAIGVTARSGSPLAGFELWSGPELVTAVPAAGTMSSERFEWTPPAAGLHAFVVRAYDTTGGAVTAPPVWVRVRELTVADQPPLGSTGVANAVDVSAPPDRGAMAVDVSFRRQSATFPAVVVDAGSCSAVITVPPQAGDTGLAVYMAPLGAPLFSPPVLAPAGSQITIPIGGPMLVFGSTFNAAVATPTAPVLVDTAGECAAAASSTEASFDQGKVAAPDDIVAVYLYVTDDGESWRRVPPTDQSAVGRGPGGTFDFAGYLAAQAPGTQRILEVWGRTAAGNPRSLGRLTVSAPVSTGGSGVAAGAPIVPSGGLDWVLSGPKLVRTGTICTFDPIVPAGGGIATLPDLCTNAPGGTIEHTFRWAPVFPGSGVLQVSVVQPPVGGALSYLGLIHSQPVSAPAAGIDVEVPLTAVVAAAIAPLPGPGPVTTGNDPMTYQAVLQLVGSGGGGGSGPNTVTAAPPAFFNGLKPSLLYVRVVPVDAAGNVLPGTTNTVEISLSHEPPSPKPPTANAVALTAQVQPPRLPNPDFSYCVRVVENPFSNPFGHPNPVPTATPEWFAAQGIPIPLPVAPESWYQWLQPAAPGNTLCAAKPKPPEKDIWDHIVDAVNFVAWVWDNFAYVYDMLKDKVAKALAVLSGCTTVVKAAADVAGKEDSQGFTDGVCGFLSTQAVNYGLALAGLPPNAPKFADVVEAAKGDVSDWIVEGAVQAGYLDCGSTLQSTCEEMAGELIDEVLDLAQEELSKAAKQVVANAGYVLALHPGIEVVPEPAGTLSPAVIQLTFTRSADPGAAAPPASCPITARVLGDKPDHTWWSYVKQKQEQGLVQASDVMIPKTLNVDLSKLAPGESKTVAVALDTIGKFYPPGRDPKLAVVPWNVKPETWIFFTKGATLTLFASTCAGVVSVPILQTGLPTQPGEITLP